MSRWAAAGAILWLALVAGRLTGLTRLTLIDLLFLLAPLVIAPLGLRLIAFATSPGSGLMAAAVRSQPVGAAFATVAFLLPIGVAAAIFASVWLLVCAIAALGALADLLEGRSFRPVRLAPAAAAVFFFRSTSLVESTPARTLLRLSALAPLAPMVLAVEYSAGHIFGFPTLDIQAMALIHGDLNALGFSLLGLVGWSIDQRLALRLRST